DPLGELGGLVAGKHGRPNDDELVTADARQDVVPAETLAQALGDLGQDAIPDRMPERVVDLLELVEIDVAHRYPRARRLREQVQAGVQNGTVEKTGEGIVLCEVGDRLAVPLAVGDVVDDGKDVAPVWSVMDQGQGAQSPREAAVLAEIAFLGGHGGLRGEL